MKEINLHSFCDELEKIALNALQKRIISGTVSPAAVSRARPLLRSSERMAEGLNIGSKNIADRLGVSIHDYDPVDLQRRWTELQKAKSGFLTKEFWRHPIQGIASRIKTLREVGPLQTTRDVAGYNKALGYGGGVTLTPQGILQPGGLKNRILFGNKPSIHLTGARVADLSEEGNKYLGAVIKRHEVDEARALASGKSFYRTTGGAAWSPQQGMTSAHLDPSVLVNESRAMTFAPEDAKKFWTGVRTDLREAPALREHGIEYAKATPLAGSTGERKVLKSLREGAYAESKPEI